MMFLSIRQAVSHAIRNYPSMRVGEVQLYYGLHACNNIVMHIQSPKPMKNLDEFDLCTVFSSATLKVTPTNP